MLYFTSRDIAAISMSAAIWSVLNVIISPILWNMTHSPFFCDMIGFACLIFATWWTRKLGTATLVGVIATIINLMLSPGALQMVGFAAASIFFDLASRVVGYDTMFRSEPAQALNSASSQVSCLTSASNSSSFFLISSQRGFISQMALSIVSAAIAGIIIGSLFMNPQFLATMGGLLFFVGLHVTGGVLGGVLGFILVRALKNRRVIPD